MNLGTSTGLQAACSSRRKTMVWFDTETRFADDTITDVEDAFIYTNNDAQLMPQLARPSPPQP